MNWNYFIKKNFQWLFGFPEILFRSKRHNKCLKFAFIYQSDGVLYFSPKVTKKFLFSFEYHHELLDLNTFDTLPMFPCIFVVILLTIDCPTLARGSPVRLIPESL